MPVCMYACMYKCMHAFGFMSPFLTSLVITVLFLLHDHLHSVLAHSLVLAHHLAPSRVVQLALDKFLPVSGQRDRPRAHGLVSAAAQSLDDLAGDVHHKIQIDSGRGLERVQDFTLSSAIFVCALEVREHVHPVLRRWRWHLSFLPTAREGWVDANGSGRELLKEKMLVVFLEQLHCTREVAAAGERSTG